VERFRAVFIGVHSNVNEPTVNNNAYYDLTAAVTVTATTIGTPSTMLQTNIPGVFGGMRRITAHVDENPSMASNPVICSIMGGFLTIQFGTDVVGRCEIEYTSVTSVDVSALSGHCFTVGVASSIRSGLVARTSITDNMFIQFSTGDERREQCITIGTQVNELSTFTLSFESLDSVMTSVTYTIDELCFTPATVCEHQFLVDGVPVTSAKRGDIVTAKLDCVPFSGFSDIAFIIPSEIGTIIPESKTCAVGAGIIETTDSRNGFVVSDLATGQCSFDFIATGPSTSDLSAQIESSGPVPIQSGISFSGKAPLDPCDIAQPTTFTVSCGGEVIDSEARKLLLRR